MYPWCISRRHNTAISYLSRCRDIPTSAQVAEHLKVPARTAGKIVAAAKMSQCFLMDTMPLKLANSNVVGWYLADLKAEPTEVLIVLTLGSDNSLIARHQCEWVENFKATIPTG